MIIISDTGLPVMIMMGMIKTTACLFGRKISLKTLKYIEKGKVTPRRSVFMMSDGGIEV